MEQDKDTSQFATAAMLWRLNMLGLLSLNDEPAEPLKRGPMKEVIAETVRRGMWSPARGLRGPVRSG